MSKSKPKSKPKSIANIAPALPPRAPAKTNEDPVKKLHQDMVRWCAMLRGGLDTDFLLQLMLPDYPNLTADHLHIGLKAMELAGTLKRANNPRFYLVPGGLLKRHHVLGSPLPGALKAEVERLFSLKLTNEAKSNPYGYGYSHYYSLGDELDVECWIFWAADAELLSHRELRSDSPMVILANELSDPQFAAMPPAFQGQLGYEMLWLAFQESYHSDTVERIDLWYRRLIRPEVLATEHLGEIEGIALMALWRGDRALLAHFEQASFLRSMAYGALLNGQMSKATEWFEELWQKARKASGKRKYHLHGGDGCLHVLLLATQPDQLQHALELSLWLSEDVGFDTLHHYIKHQMGTLDAGANAHPRLTNDPILLPWQLLAYYGMGVETLATPTNQTWINRSFEFLIQRQFHWLAAQLAAAAAQCGFKAPDITTDFPPLTTLIARQEKWQTALDALTRLAAADKAGDAETRLVWWLNLDNDRLQLEPREQKRTAKGWSKGRRLPQESVRGGKRPPSASDQDMAALNAMQYADYGLYAPKPGALLALVGHPAVYWEHAPDSRVEVVAGQIVLRLRKASGGMLLDLDPAVSPGENVVWKRETPTRMVVCQVSGAHRQIADIIRNGLTLPAGSEDRAVAALTHIAPQITIHSEVGSLGAAIPEVPANPQLYLHLLPQGEGLAAQPLVQPLSDGRWHEPGAGAAVVLGEKDGKPLQTRRDLKAEKAALQQLEDLCPVLQDRPLDDRQWLLPDALESLELLEQVGAHPELVQLVWPEGVRFKVRSLSMVNFKVKVTSQQDWFAIAGGVQLDEKRVLGIQELLQLARENSGRFLALGDGEYLALTEAFRRRVAALANLADIGKKDAKISRLASGILDEVLDDLGDVELDDAWHAYQAKLAAAQAYQPTLPTTLQAELRDYQLQGFQWLARLAHWGVGACLADDMGLGKTLQTLALLVTRAPAGPALVIAPTSVCPNWISEVERFAPTLNVVNYADARVDIRNAGPFDLIIASYGLLQQDIEHFTAKPWHTLVLDEAQAIKNAQTKRAQAVLALQADFRCALSGTPVENHLGELWSLYRFLNPGLLGSEARFNERFATPISRGDHAARDTLRLMLRPFVLRRTKAQVLSELPPRTEITLPVALSPEEMALYEATRRQSLDKLATPGEGPKLLQMLAEIMKLRRLCCHPRLVEPGSTLPGSKLAAFAELVQHIIDNKHKALVFSQFVDHLSIVRHWLDEAGIRYQYLDGSTVANDRKKRVDAFQSGAGDVFLISLKAGGVGLNLTAADYVIHLDPWWNPAVEDQASDRAHRIGQQRPVTIYRLVAQHTIEEKIVALHASKRQLADSLLDGGDTSAKLSEDALLQLLREGAGMTA